MRRRSGAGAARTARSRGRARRAPSPRMKAPARRRTRARGSPRNESRADAIDCDSVGNVDIVKRSYEAFARGDMNGVLADVHPEIEWQQAQGLPHGGVYHGVAAGRRAVFDPLRGGRGGEFFATPPEVLHAGTKLG